MCSHPSRIETESETVSQNSSFDAPSLTAPCQTTSLGSTQFAHGCGRVEGGPEIASVHFQLGPERARRVPQVRFLNLGLGVEVLFQAEGQTGPSSSNDSPPIVRLS